MFIDGRSDRLKRLAATLLVFLALFSGCIRNIIAPTPAPTPSPTPTPQPAIMLLVSEGLPTLVNHPHQPSVNGALIDYFGALRLALSSAIARDPSIALSYRIEEDEGEIRLLSSIAIGGVPLLALPDVVVHDNGEVRLPPVSPAAALSDGQFIAAALELARRGIVTNVARYGSNADTRDLTAYLVSAYESLADAPVDQSGIDASITDQLWRKACALGIADYWPSLDAFPVYEVGISSAADSVADWMSHVYSELYAKGSRAASSGDVTALMDYFLSIMQAGLGRYDDSIPYMGDKPPASHEYRLQVDLKQVLPENLFSGADITRARLSHFFVPAFESVMGAASAARPSYLAAYETQDKMVYKALNAAVMFTYPGSNTFSPDEPVRLYQLPRLACSYAENLYFSWALSQSEDLFQPLAYQQLAPVIAGLLALYQGAPPPASVDTLRVENDRDWDWYFTQNDGSPYSDINCMPAATAMALLWRDRNFAQTPRMLRERYPQNTEPWTMQPVEHTLEAFAAQYDRRHILLANMLEDLDSGSILFCMINEGDLFRTGHCFIVYGYIQKGESLWMLTYDSGYDLTPDQYGKPRGQARLVEANYAVFITQRHSNYYIRIDP